MHIDNSPSSAPSPATPRHCGGTGSCVMCLFTPVSCRLSMGSWTFVGWTVLGHRDGGGRPLLYPTLAPLQVGVPDGPQTGRYGQGGAPVKFMCACVSLPSPSRCPALACSNIFPRESSRPEAVKDLERPNKEARLCPAKETTTEEGEEAKEVAAAQMAKKHRLAGQVDPPAQASQGQLIKTPRRKIDINYKKESNVYELNKN